MRKMIKAFTLIEIIIVIAIIGVLVAILVPSLTSYFKDAKYTTANANAKQIYVAVNNYAKMCKKENDVNMNLTVDSWTDIGSDGYTDEDLDYSGDDIDVRIALIILMGNSKNPGFYQLKVTDCSARDVMWKQGPNETVVGGYPTEGTSKSPRTALE